MTEMTAMLLIPGPGIKPRYQTATWTKLGTDTMSARTHTPDTRAHRDDRSATQATTRPEHRGLSRAQLHSGAGGRQVDRADRRPAPSRPEALQRPQADAPRPPTNNAPL